MSKGSDSVNVESFLFGSFQDASTSEGMILSNVPVSDASRPVNRTYSLSQAKGLQVSFYMFNQFRIYSKNQLFTYGSKNEPKSANLYIAYANIPLNTTSSRAPIQKNSAIPGMSSTTSAAISLTLSCYVSMAFAFLLCISS